MKRTRKVKKKVRNYYEPRKINWTRKEKGHGEVNGSGHASPKHQYRFNDSAIKPNLNFPN